MEAKKRPWSAWTHLLAPSSSAYLRDDKAEQVQGVGSGEQVQGVGSGEQVQGVGSGEQVQGVGGGESALDVNIAEHVVTNVAADVELLHAAVSDRQVLRVT
jgi:hypothetical protein